MLYLITNRNIKKGDFHSIILKATEAGVDRVILREKDLEYEELLKLSLEIKEIVKNRNKELIINGNLDIAKKINADGFQCSYDYFMENKIEFNGFVGVSVHSIDQAIKVSEKDADYILVSHIYPTECKKGLEAKGIDYLMEVKKKTSIDVVALGGINEKNLVDLKDKGVRSIAVMSYIMTSENPYRSTRLLKNIMNS